MAGFKFEDYRQAWETGPHWELKREFMEKYSDMFQEDRLLCLAQAYSNIVLMNCSYPEPVMRQISLLAEPLQMRKKFQEKDEGSSAETPEGIQQREKMKLLYKNSGRPFKQVKLVKFCASEDQSQAAVPPEPMVLNQSSQHDHNLQSSITVAQEIPQSRSILTVNDSDNSSKYFADSCNIINQFQNVKPILTLNDNEKSVGNFAFSGDVALKSQHIENNSESKSSYIVDALGLELIQKFVQKIRTFQVRLISPLISIVSAAQSLKIDKMIDFQFNLEPNCPSHAPIYCCKFSIKDCLISAEKAGNKKLAKSKSAETAVDILIKLSNQTPMQSSEKCNAVEPIAKSVSETMSVTVNESFTKNNSSVATQSMDINKAHQEDMNVLQKLADFCANKNPDLTTLRLAAAKLNMKNCIFLQRTVQKDPVSVDEKFEWKCFFKSTLISCVKCKSHKEGETSVVKCAFDKLRNLSNYIIENGELKERPNMDLIEISNPEPEIKVIKEETKNVKPVPFVLNKCLFNSSMRDGFVLVDNLVNRILLKNFKNMLSESANFCKKSFEYQIDEFSETFPPQLKVQVLIGDVVVGTGVGTSKEEAKTNACNNAVEILRKKYYTLQIKNTYSDNCTIFRDQAFSADSSSSGALSESNIGCKMLKNMGWTGGGLGTSGIAEPIEVSTQHGFGIGLGYKQGDNYTVFKKRINSMLMDFSASNSFSDLIFSKEFSKDERKDIHKFAARYNLHTGSRGVLSERYLTVRRKYSVIQILEYLEQVGGSSIKFELIDASKDELNPFKISNAF